MTKINLKKGDVCPAFTGVDQNGTRISLDDARFLNKAIVLFFYAKDDSKSCTTECTEFRDNYKTFQEAGAEVIGISPNDSQSHQKFAQSHNIQFSLISDTDGEIARKFGVHKELFVFPARTTFILDRNHRVDTVYSSLASLIKPENHIKESLNAINSMKNTTHVAGTVPPTTTKPAVSNPIS